MSDFRLAIREFVRSRVTSIVALFSLAIGIGANTAIFSLVNDFLLKPLPVRNPHELVLLRNIEAGNGRMSSRGENNGSIDPLTGRAASTSFALLAFARMREQHALDPQFRAITRAAQDLRVDELFERDPLRRWGRESRDAARRRGSPDAPACRAGSRSGDRRCRGPGACALERRANRAPALRHYEHVRERRTPQCIRTNRTS
jgi:hypothetical protein